MNSIDDVAGDTLRDETDANVLVGHYTLVQAATQRLILHELVSIRAVLEKIESKLDNKK